MNFGAHVKPQLAVLLNVYKAEQRHPIRRVVAVKLIKLGTDIRDTPPTTPR
jgi:hypothetical protein